MLHLIKNSKGKFEVVTVSNGNYIVGSHQGYERKSGAYSNMRAQMKSFGIDFCHFQDDTLDNPSIFLLTKKGKPTVTSNKSKKKYIPSKK